MIYVIGNDIFTKRFYEMSVSMDERIVLHVLGSMWQLMWLVCDVYDVEFVET